MIRNMKELLEEARTGEPGRLAVAVAQDSFVLDAVVQAAELGVVAPVLVGDREQIEQILVDLKTDPRAYRIIDEADKTEACMIAARLVRDGEADFLMKGIVDTAVIMRAILNRDNGLRTGRMISDVLALEIEGYDHLFLVTDPAMSIAPTLEQKVDLVRNAMDIAHALGNDNPKVAVLAAVEKVNEKMPCTVDAAELQAMNERGEIEGCVVQGPLQFDNAVSVEAAKHKGISPSPPAPVLPNPSSTPSPSRASWPVASRHKESTCIASSCSIPAPPPPRWPSTTIPRRSSRPISATLLPSWLSTSRLWTSCRTADRSSRRS